MLIEFVDYMSGEHIKEIQSNELPSMEQDILLGLEINNTITITYNGGDDVDYIIQAISPRIDFDIEDPTYGRKCRIIKRYIVERII